ncbi:hypothetical protein CYY_010285, partial [Polysphondylium violaceum]
MTITDLTPPETNNVYGTFVSAQTVCTFVYIIKAEDANGARLTSPNTGELLVKTDTTAIYKITFPQESGSGTLTLQFQDNLNAPTNYPIQYECLAPPNTLTGQLLTQKMIVNYKYSKKGNPIIIFKFNNDRPIQGMDSYVGGNQFTVSKPIPIDYQHYYLEFSLNNDYTLWSGGFSAVITVTVSWNPTIATTFTVEPFIKQAETLFTLTTAIDIYPNLANSIVLDTLIYEAAFILDQPHYLYTQVATDTGVYKSYQSPLPKMVLGNLTRPIFYGWNALSDLNFDLKYMIYKDGSFFTYPWGNLAWIGSSITPPSLTGGAITLLLGDRVVHFQGTTTKTILYGEIENNYQTGVMDTTLTISFPFGYSSGSSGSYKYTMDLFYAPFVYGGQMSIDFVNLQTYTVNVPSTLPDLTPPNIVSITKALLDKSIVYTLYITDDTSGFLSFATLGGSNIVSHSDMVYGTLKTGYYEIVFNPEIDFIQDYTARLCDRVYNCKTLYLNNPLTVDQVTMNYRQFSIKDTTNIFFDEYTMNTQEQYLNNTLHMETAFTDVNWVPQMFIEFNNKPTKMYPGHWDADLSHYVIPFTVDKNSIEGSLNYYFLDSSLTKVYGSNLKSIYSFSEVQLLSDNGDEYGPVVLNIARLPGASATMTGSGSSISWEFTIKDHYNGFKSGYVEFMGSLDLSFYSFNFTTANLTTGHKFEGVYRFVVPIEGTCVSQKFYLTLILLTDECDYTSSHTRRNNGERGFDPMRAFLDNFDASSSIDVVCPTNTDLTFPTLSSFQKSKTQYDPFGSDQDRTVVFDFTTSDQVGLIEASVPTVYLQDQSFGIIEKKATFLTKTATDSNYQCTMTIPYGFGVDGGVGISIFGIVDRYGHFNGYSVSDLDSLGYVSIINSIDGIIPLPIINSVSEIKSAGGFATLLGRAFQQTDLVVITYMNSTAEQIVPSFNSLTIMVFKIGQVLDQTIKLKVKKTSNSLFSNEITVTIQDLPPVSPNPSNTPSVTPNVTPSVSPTPQITTPPPIVTPSPTTLPTNPPQKCLGEPACGGPDKGTCTAKGCVCISPWIGIDCTSKVLQIDQLKLNTTSPTLTLTSKPTNNNNNNNNDQVFASIAVIG